MKTSRTKVLYISSIVPDTSCGAHIAIYRHFVVKNDFEVAVCSYNPEQAQVKNKFRIDRYQILRRAFNSRFSRVAYNIEYLVNWFWLPTSLIRYAMQFQPDVVVTVPDNMHSGLAYRLSKRLRVPLVADFQDLFPISRFIAGFMEPYPWVRRFLLKRFFKLHNSSSLCFYTSEGMRDFFGFHSNGHVLYPIGDFNIAKLPFENRKGSDDKPMTIVYAGNCYGAYGRMLLQFARLAKNSNQIHLRIFPVGKGWSDEDIAEMTAAGIYQTFMPFEKLKEQLAQADSFLTVMSFEDQEKPFVSTSFTTKWLDYAPYGKPIFVWGPDYSSAVIFARKYGCGVVSTGNAADLMRTVLKAKDDEREWHNYSVSAKRTSETILNPEAIHSILVTGIQKVAQKGPGIPESTLEIEKAIL